MMHHLWQGVKERASEGRTPEDGLSQASFELFQCLRIHSLYQRPKQRSCLTPGISGERPFNVHERQPVARVRCMPVLGGVFDVDEILSPYFSP